MSRAWKPGDVAIRSYLGAEQVSLFVECHGHRNVGAHHWHHTNGGFDAAEYADRGSSDNPTYHPLVVIDPEDESHVDDLQDAVIRTGTQIRWDVLQDALREFADPKPPKPPEPTGLGAVVERQDGRRWVRREDGQWTNLDAEGMYLNWSSWSEISEGSPVVRVLSEGVTA